MSSSRRLTVGGAVASGKPRTWAVESGTTWVLIQSSSLTIEFLVANLKARYDRDLIYTLCGSILVAVNPFKSVADEWYTPAVVAQYRGQPIGSQPPHLYAIADAAFSEMVAQQDS